MAPPKVVVTVNADAVLANRSTGIESAVQERVATLDRSRLARECAKLDPAEEQALAEEGYAGQTAWPTY